MAQDWFVTIPCLWILYNLFSERLLHARRLAGHLLHVISHTPHSKDPLCQLCDSPSLHMGARVWRRKLQSRGPPVSKRQGRTGRQASDCKAGSNHQAVILKHKWSFHILTSASPYISFLETNLSDSCECLTVVFSGFWQPPNLITLNCQLFVQNGDQWCRRESTHTKSSLWPQASVTPLLCFKLCFWKITGNNWETFKKLTE